MVNKIFRVRLYLEVRYDIDVEEQLGVINAKDAAKFVLDGKHGMNLYEIVSNEQGEYAENIHAISVDTYNLTNKTVDEEEINVNEIEEEIAQYEEKEI